MAQLSTLHPVTKTLTPVRAEVSEEPNKKTKNEEEEEQAPKYRLAMRQSYPEPIFNVRAVDLTSDGVNEIVVSSLRGLHVAQVCAYTHVDLHDMLCTEISPFE